MKTESETQPTCSVLLPSRKRPEKLLNTVRSVKASTQRTDYEILIRLDQDDTDSLAIDSQLESLGCKVFIGERLGYHMLDAGYYAGLEREASGVWSFILGDDAEIHGDWLEELSKVPTTGFIVQPEISKLGLSAYPRAEAQAFPIFPRFCWKQFQDTFPVPFDINGHLLLLKHGWKTWFLNGVTFHHLEGTPEELAQHRKL